MIRSGGVLVKGQFTAWEGTPATWQGWPTKSGAGWPFPFGAGASYSEMYRSQLWVSVLVNKIANAAARLPLKVYERTAQGREDGSPTPYGQLLARPSTMLDPFLFWLWTVATLNIQGEAFWGKLRDNGDRPYELVPLHPLYVRNEMRDGRMRWWYESGATKLENIPRRDLVHFRMFNPDSMVRGMSPLEPLRSTLENEEGARRANSAMWRSGGRPSVILEHPGHLTQDTAQRLAVTWSSLHGGVDNWAKTAVLEEGMKANVMSLNSEELQYIEARRLNREEVCAAYDVPPPVVHILDRATFSNITAQMRSMYRDTMAPKLGLFESTLEFELRDGRFGDLRRGPDFGEQVYAEFLMDGVLRGDFEMRTAAMSTAIQSGYMMPSEAREMENLPFVEGSDQLLVNGALMPLNGELGQPSDGIVPTGRSVDGEVIPLRVMRGLLSRLGRAKSLAEVDVDSLEVPDPLHHVLETWKAHDEPIDTVRAKLAGLTRNEVG